jgi:beta-lactamase regulating signal transducer with metallopeptidase domain
MSLGVLVVLPLLTLVLPIYVVPFEWWPKQAMNLTQTFRTDTISETAAIAERPLSAATLLLVGYFTISLLLLLRTAIGFLRMRLHVRRYRHIDQAQAIALLDQVRRRLGIEKQIGLVVDASGAGPYAWGINKQVIVVPREFLTAPSDVQRTVLTHELIHVLRRDTSTCLVARILCCLYWINPVMWLWNDRLKLEMEQSCDDQAVGSGIDAADYASHLLAVIQLFDIAHRPSASVAMARASSIQYRVRSLLNNERQRGIMSTSKSVAVGSALILVGVAAGVFAANPDPATLSGSITDEARLANVQRLVPDLCDTDLREVSFGADTVAFKGHCRTEIRISAFLRNLAREGGVPKLTAFEKTEDGYDFRILIANWQNLARPKL